MTTKTNLSIVTAKLVISIETAMITTCTIATATTTTTSTTATSSNTAYTSTSTGPATTGPKDSSCKDINPNCKAWAANSYCSSSDVYMNLACMTTCNTCKPGVLSVCQNHNENCVGWQKAGECERTPEYMRVLCPLVCNYCTAGKAAPPFNSTVARFKGKRSIPEPPQKPKPLENAEKFEKN